MLSQKVASAITRADERLEKTKDLTNDSAFRQISQIVENEQAERKADIIVPKSVLWVDDRPNNNSSERRALEAYKIRFDLAESTGEALAKLNKKRYDLIITDMGRLPDPRAGYTLLQILRSGGNHVPYYIYAGSRDPMHVKEALSLGAQGTTNLPTELITDVLAALQ